MKIIFEKEKKQKTKKCEKGPVETVIAVLISRFKVILC